jgi:hypothetical protein
MARADLSSLLDVRQNQLSIEISAGDSIDVKALGLLAGNVAVLIFIGQANEPRTWLSTLLVVSFLVASALTIAVIWPRAYAGASASIYDHPEYVSLPKLKLIEQLLIDTEAAIKQNETINKERLLYCKWAFWVTIVASLLLCAVLYFKLI